MHDRSASPIVCVFEGFLSKSDFLSATLGKSLLLSWAAPVPEKPQPPRKTTRELHVESAQGFCGEVTDSSYQSRGKKPHSVRLRTSRFLCNLLNICSWSRDMAKVKVWGFFFFPPVGISLYILKPKNCCLFLKCIFGSSKIQFIVSRKWLLGEKKPYFCSI